MGRFRKAVGTLAIAARRAGQAKAWLRAELSDSLMAALSRHPGVAKRLPALEAKVVAGSMTPGAAARELLTGFLGHQTPAKA